MSACLLSGAAAQVARFDAIASRAGRAIVNDDGVRQQKPVLRWRTDAREHLLKPHNASLFSVAAQPAGRCAFFYGVLRTMGGASALDVTVVDSVAVVIFGGAHRTRLAPVSQSSTELPVDVALTVGGRDVD